MNSSLSNLIVICITSTLKASHEPIDNLSRSSPSGVRVEGQDVVDMNVSKDTSSPSPRPKWSPLRPPLDIRWTLRPVRFSIRLICFSNQFHWGFPIVSYCQITWKKTWLFLGWYGRRCLSSGLPPVSLTIFRAESEARWTSFMKPFDCCPEGSKKSNVTRSLEICTCISSTVDIELRDEDGVTIKHDMRREKKEQKT